MKNLLFLIGLIAIILFGKTTSAQIASISPDTVRQGELLDIEVTTENFEFSQGTNFVIFKQNNITKYINQVKPGNQRNTFIISTIFNNLYPVGFYDLHIKSNFDNKIDITKTNALYVLPDLTAATIDSISIHQARIGESIEMKIYATNTNFNKNGIQNKVYLSSPLQNIHASSVVPVDSRTLKAAFHFTYSYNQGIYSVHLLNDYDGSQTLPNVFELKEAKYYPVIASVNPDTIVQGQTLDIQITGKDIDFTQGTNVVTLDKGNIIYYLFPVVAISKDSLKGGITVRDDAPLGDYNLSVRNSALDITLIANQTIMKENAFYLKKGTVGNNDIFLSEEKMLIFPNPVQKYIYLESGINEVSIFDSKGRLVLKSKHSREINVSNLKKGIYIVQARLNGKLKSQKIIID